MHIKSCKLGLATIHRGVGEIRISKISAVGICKRNFYAL